MNRFPCRQRRNLKYKLVSCYFNFSISIDVRFEPYWALGARFISSYFFFWGFSSKNKQLNSCAYFSITKRSLEIWYSQRLVRICEENVDLTRLRFPDNLTVKCLTERKLLTTKRLDFSYATKIVFQLVIQSYSSYKCIENSAYVKNAFYFCFKGCTIQRFSALWFSCAGLKLIKPV